MDVDSAGNAKARRPLVIKGNRVQPQKRRAWQGTAERYVGRRDQEACRDSVAAVSTGQGQSEFYGRGLCPEVGVGRIMMMMTVTISDSKLTGVQ